MKKLIWFNMVTVDGYFEGPGRDIRWHHLDGEFNEFANEQLDTIDTIFLGRVTYDLMAGYWSTDLAKRNDPITARNMNSKQKIVFSRTLKKAGWDNTELVKEVRTEEITALKKSVGKDLILFGSANLASTLIELNLIDEYRIMLNPVVLGAGKPMFRKLQKAIDLVLVRTRIFESGNILLYYQNKKS